MTASFLADPDVYPDEATIRAALEAANPNALRMAVIEITGDVELSAMRIEKRNVRGGAMSVPALTREDRDKVIERALTLLSQGPVAAPGTTRDDAAELLRIFGSDLRTADLRDLALDELGFPDPLADATLAGVAADKLDQRSVTIIGAGISAIALAIRLKRLGVPFCLLERQADIGGTWQLNDYPEARVDITTFIYQFRSERNYPWPALFAPQPEIKRYLKHIVEKFGLAEHVILNTSVSSARWIEDGACWEIVAKDRDGTEQRYRSAFLISAAGLFSTPNIPDIAGSDSFQGPIFHTTQWDHSADLSAKRVGLIGNGSSGVQLMPWLARNAGHLTVFQRSPNWITPVDDYRKPVAAALHWLFSALPTYWHWHCFALSALDKQVESLQVEDPQWRSEEPGMNERHELYRRYLSGYIEEQLAERPDLLDKCLPTYPPLARRMVVDSGWFQALKRDNVALVSQPVVRLDQAGAVTSDGHRYDLDAIVLGTGFRASEFLCTVDYTGLGGVKLADLWKEDGARAYLGMFLPHFPNFAIFYGPNGQPQSGSFHDWADRCARMITNLIAETAKRGETKFEISSEAYGQYNRELDDRMRAMVWGREGASGYYINEHGRPITKMPWRADEYYRRISDGDFDLFFEHAVDAGEDGFPE